MKRQTKITTALLVFTVFCFGMEFTRMYRSCSLSYIFLVWNLVLAWVPYLLSLKFMQYDLKRQTIAPLGVLFIWILFLPNGPYIITDLLHLRLREPIPMWYDVLLVSTVAWNGLLLTMLSVGNIHRKLQQYFSPFKLWAGLFILFFSAGYGIYVGRFLRLNSWDFFLRPVRLLHYTLLDVIHPFHHTTAVWVTVLIGIILSFSYAIFYLITHQSNLNHETI
jgi:uncharacterized membrane protein